MLDGGQSSELEHSCRSQQMVHSPMPRRQYTRPSDHEGVHFGHPRECTLFHRFGLYAVGPRAIGDRAGPLLTVGSGIVAPGDGKSRNSAARPLGPLTESAFRKADGHFAQLRGHWARKPVALVITVPRGIRYTASEHDRRALAIGRSFGLAVGEIAWRMGVPERTLHRHYAGVFKDASWKSAVPPFSPRQSSGISCTSRRARERRIGRSRH
jgi:hypothetical protein